ncbi:hypothetical protein DICVIV_00727 [Dictyocaulus viviparus]|uniref:Uncharacterized protein n=1 Tax=Dictyocaulus viviparus TaxID=29172 RepID=A0A0D8YA12_DICVI|nr:hypothetical protein DICVIV_00727 [Dictyocaulus viviparus]
MMSTQLSKRCGIECSHGDDVNLSLGFFLKELIPKDENFQQQNSDRVDQKTPDESNALLND